MVLSFCNGSCPISFSLDTDDARRLYKRRVFGADRAGFMGKGRPSARMGTIFKREVNMRRQRMMFLGLFFVLVTASGLQAQKPAAVKETSGTQTGIAIYYSDKLVGNAVASGEKYDRNALTAAHRTLPLGTMVKVTNLANQKSVVVRINDRGPHGSKTRIIDLSGKAAEEIDLIKAGKAKVKLEVVEAAKK